MPRHSQAALRFTAAAAAGRFELQQCARCAAVQYPPREACHRCLCVDLRWTAQNGTGRLISETTLFHSHLERFRRHLPWRLGLVHLASGPTVVAHVHKSVPAAPTDVELVARLDESGYGVLIARAAGEGAMNEDARFQQMSCDPQGAQGGRMSPGFTLLTGGSSGIGAETCKLLLAAGHRVVSLDRKPGSLRSPELQEIQVDLSDPAATASAAQDLARRFPITTVIHNAGAVKQQPLERVTPDDLQTLTNLHVAAPIALVQAALPTMKARGYGRIVLVSSRAVLGLSQRTAYSATKAAMLGLARTWALELGPHGITANVIAPGPIEATEVFHDLIPKDSPKLPAIIESIPVRRLGRPEDVARAVLFFVDPQAGFVTGQTLFVCGGTSVGTIVY